MKFRETMWATMKPDCYGGPNCDRVVPQWHTYADGDKDSEDGAKTLSLAARTFPPGTKVVILEPCCPNCGELRSMKFLKPARGPLFDDTCDCGFDWKQWTFDQFS